MIADAQALEVEGIVLALIMQYSLAALTADNQARPR